MSDWQNIVRVRRGENGQIVRVLLIDSLYDVLKPVYDRFLEIAGFVTITQKPERIERAGSYLSSLIGEYGMMGWGFTLSISYLLYRAAKQAISLGKFEYVSAGLYGEGVYGSGIYSGSMIREYPVEG